MKTKEILTAGLLTFNTLSIGVLMNQKIEPREVEVPPTPTATIEPYYADEYWLKRATSTPLPYLERRFQEIELKIKTQESYVTRLEQELGGGRLKDALERGLVEVNIYPDGKEAVRRPEKDRK